MGLFVFLFLVGMRIAYCKREAKRMRAYKKEARLPFTACAARKAQQAKRKGGNDMLADHMPRVANMLGSSGITLANVRDTFKAEGMSEYDIYLTVKGAAMLYPHVAEVVREESIPDTQPGS